MATIYSIPPEILQETFLFTISDRIRVPGRREAIPYSCQPTYRSSTSPYSISHVCSRWRLISLNLPELWTYLCIRNPKSRNLICLIKEWINRSRSLPLHLALYEHTSRGHPEMTKAVLSTFLESFHRCKTFVLDIETALDDLIGAKHTQIRYPLSLDCISMRILKFSSRASTAFLSNLLRATTLRSIWVLAPIRLQDVSSSWENLQHLTIHDSIHGEYQLPQVLSHCQRLKSLEAHSWFSGPAPEHDISLPHLERLRLKWGNFVNSFLRALRVPALTQLALDCHLPINDYFIVEMLKKSKANLKSLEINAIARDSRIVKLLKDACFMGLETLRLTDLPVGLVGGEHVWPQVMFLLVARESTQTWQYLPNLQHFSLRTQNIQDVELAHLRALAQIRLDNQKHRILRVSSGSIEFAFTIPK